MCNNVIPVQGPTYHSGVYCVWGYLGLGGQIEGCPYIGGNPLFIPRNPVGAHASSYVSFSDRSYNDNPLLAVSPTPSLNSLQRSPQ